MQPLPLLWFDPVTPVPPFCRAHACPHVHGPSPALHTDPDTVPVGSGPLSFASVALADLQERSYSGALRSPKDKAESRASVQIRVRGSAQRALFGLPTWSGSGELSVMRRPDAWGRSQRLDCSGAVAGTVRLAGGRRLPCAALRFAASETVPCCLVDNFVAHRGFDQIVGLGRPGGRPVTPLGSLPCVWTIHACPAAPELRDCSGSEGKTSRGLQMGNSHFPTPWLSMATWTSTNL